MPFFPRRAAPNPHQACRSVLQKAVRRGQVAVTREAALHLIAAGDKAWLKQRIGVIVFEECWPLAVDLDWSADPAAMVGCLTRAAAAVKVKDATGLGSLAYALTKGKESVLAYEQAAPHIVRVAQAIERPDGFWAWARQQARGEREQTLVAVAQRAHRRGGWPWDQAFILAAAYLAVTAGVPEAQRAAPVTEAFPYWVALDRHTPQGKVALAEVARKEGLPISQLRWTSFYFEGAVTNDATPSRWWDTEIEWRLRQVGLAVDEGREFWRRARPAVEAALVEEVAALREHLAVTDPALAPAGRRGAVRGGLAPAAVVDHSRPAPAPGEAVLVGGGR